MYEDYKAVYKDEVARYTKKDAVHALFFALYISLLLFGVIFGLSFLADVIETGRIVGELFTLPVVLFALLPLYFIVRKKGQGLRSLGLHLHNWKAAFAAGLFFIVVILMLYNGLLPGLLAGWQFRPAWVIALAVVRTLILAFYEDVVFFGYIQTRIYGLIKKDIPAVFVCGLIFAFNHFLEYIAANIIAGGSFGLGFWTPFINPALLYIAVYIVMNAVFRRFRSIIPVTMLHFAHNFSAGGGRLWEGGGGDGFNYSISFVIVILSVLLVTVILPRLKKTKRVVK